MPTVVDAQALADSIRGGVIEDVRIKPELGEMHICLVGGRVIVILGSFIVGSCLPAESIH